MLVYLSLLIHKCFVQRPASARRPCKAALGQHMKVQVLNALAAVRADIGHNAVAALVDAQLFAQLRNDRVDVAQQRGVILGQGCGRRNVLLRDDEKMHGSLRVDVVERQQLSSSNSLFEGISPAAILQNRQSSIRNPSFAVDFMAKNY